MVEERIQLVPAAGFSLEELTEAYNQTRVDYLVPMPMTPSRLADYARLYDVDLQRSRVAVDRDTVLGLAMLGLRKERAWVTRLGVLPASRQRGVGEKLVQSLLGEAHAAGCRRAVLEVIEGNAAAYGLFFKLGFRETRRLLVLRRPTGPPTLDEPRGQVRWTGGEEALELLERLPAALPWTNEIESYSNAGGGQGMAATLDGGSGRLVFLERPQLLSHFVFETCLGSPVSLAATLLHVLYQRYPAFESDVENIPTNDPHLPALLQAGFEVVFRRIEMALDLSTDL